MTTPEPPAAGHPPPPAPPEPGAGVFTLGLWTVLFAAALAFVVAYGPSFPRWDDFAMIPVLTGSQRVDLGWLWSQHNEHRIPLPRLVLLGLLRLSGWDFRAGMVFNVTALAALALLSAVVARRRRGAWRATDAFFPLVLLNLGHHANLLWAWQVQFVLSTVFAGILLLLIASSSSRPGFGKTAAIGVLLALLPLCGANGVALVPALALWLAAEGVVQVRGNRVAGLFCLVVAALALGLVALYFRGYQGAAHHAAQRDIAAAVVTSLQFSSLALGPSAATLWPYSGILLAALIAASVGLLLRVLVVRPAERPRAFGLLAFLGALGSLALGLGWGRAGASAAGGFEARYVTLAAPLGCALYFVWDLYGGTPALRRLVPLGLLATALVLLWPNTQAGLADGKELAAKAAAMVREIRAGTPTFLVVKHATPFLHPSEDELARVLPQLRDARLGVFRFLKPDPAFREIAVPLDPTETRMVRWERGTAHVTGVDPQLTFALPEARYVAGIRLRYAHASPEGGPARFKLAWRRPPQVQAPPEQVSANWNLPTGPGRETTVWVGEPVKEILIQPDNRPCEFRVESLVLLVPAEPLSRRPGSTLDAAPGPGFNSPDVDRGTPLTGRTAPRNGEPAPPTTL